MPITNKLKKVLDLPIWEWMNPLPQIINNAASAWSTAQSGNHRYIYYSLTTVFYRYDTVTNVWASLIPPTYYTPAVASTMQCQMAQGTRGRILETLSPTKFRVPYMAGGTVLEGTEMRIMYGPGAQEVRKITVAENATTHDSGNLTSGNTTQIADTTKKWKVNQWVGYTCRIITGANQVEQRNIVFNTETVLYFTDTTLQPYEPWDNQGFRSNPTANATYEITSQIVEVDTAFNVTPTPYSRFMMKTGIIWLMSSSTAAPFFTFQMYDILTNTWYQKTMNSNIFPSAVGAGGEIQIESTSDLTGPLVTGTATSGTIRTLTDASLNLEWDRYRNYSIRIIKGAGAGQDKRIVANKTDYFEVDSKWTVAPDATSEYEIYPDDNLVYFIGGGNAATFAYHMEADMWITGPYFDYGVLGNTVVKKEGDVGFGISSATRATGGVTSIAVSAGGLNYAVGDTLTIASGTSASFYVTSVDITGAVTGVEIKRCGSGYTTGIKTTIGGIGTGCTINVLSVGVIGRVTTTTSHMFKTGDVVSIFGANEIAWNNTYIILGILTTNTFDVEITATADLVPAFITSTTLLVDANENWDINEHVGKFILVASSTSITPTTQIRRITSNTATTITTPAFTTISPASGTTRYIILNPASYGRDTKFQAKDQYPFGYATSGTATTLVDSTKNWTRATWVGHSVRIVAGTGLGVELIITANDATTLQFATTSFTPDTTTRYEIMDAYGTATSGSATTLVDTGKNWTVNQWVGKRARIIGGSAQSIEVAITANTANTLTFAATTAMDNTCNYVILGIPARAVGCGLKWTYGNDNDNYIWTTTGGATALVQRLNLNNQTYDYGFIVPGFLQDGLTTGTFYAYAGKDIIYIQFSGSGSLFALDIKKRTLELASRIPGAMSTAYIGNKMEIVNTEDGLQFLYIGQTGGTAMWRTLLFWD